MPDVAVVGSVNLDYVVPVGHLPVPGETVLGGDLAIAHGGKGANQAVAAARAGAGVAFIAKVGRDAAGDEVRRHLMAAGLSLDAVLEDAAAPTGVAFILVDPRGRNQIAVAPGSNMRLSPEDLRPFTFLLQGARVLLAQLETPLATVRYALRLACATHVVTILNPAPPRHLPAEIYPMLDYITPNQPEAAALCGMDVGDPFAAREAGRWFLDQGCRGVIVTLGGDGAAVVTADGAWHFPAFPVAVVDTTAAGDAFNGVLAARLAEGRRLDEAVRWATAAGALACTHRGAQESLAAAGEIEAFLAAHPAPSPARII